MAHLEYSEEFATFKEQIWFRSLLNHNIRHVEQLMGLLNNGIGRLALTEMGADLGDISTQVDEYLQNQHGTSLQAVFSGSASTPAELNYFYRNAADRRSLRTFGYHLPNALESIGYQDKLPLPESSDDKSPDSPKPESRPLDKLPAEFTLEPYDDLPTPRDQAYRGTCVAFACASMVELMLRRKNVDIQLSTQFIYYRAKKDDNNKETDGTQFTFALNALKEHGACKEEHWPYQSYPDWAYNSAFSKPFNSLRRMHDYAGKCRITDYETIRPTNDVNQIKKHLLAGKPVGVGVQTFRSVWLESEYAEHKGEIQMPLTKVDSTGTFLLDESTGGHAIVLVGYKDNDDKKDKVSHRPGGGFFVFKNSWGPRWARANVESAMGYGQIPYAYIERYCVGACVIDDVIWEG